MLNVYFRHWSNARKPRDADWTTVEVVHLNFIILKYPFYYLQNVFKNFDHINPFRRAFESPEKKERREIERVVRREEKRERKEERRVHRTAGTSGGFTDESDEGSEKRYEIAPWYKCDFWSKYYDVDLSYYNNRRCESVGISPKLHARVSGSIPAAVVYLIKALKVEPDFQLR